MTKRINRNQPPTVRCAIYTRKATDVRTNQGFNSVDVQRASAETFVGSKRDNGWVCLSNRYDDCGFSGTGQVGQCEAEPRGRAPGLLLRASGLGDRGPAPGRRPDWHGSAAYSHPTGCWQGG